MSDYGIIFQVGGGLLVLFFLYLTWQNTKTWGWQHVTLVFLNFAAAFVFCIYAAQTLKARTAWLKLLYATSPPGLEKQVADLEEQLEQATRGRPSDVEGNEPSIVALREKLSRTILDRGRVWRPCVPQQANADGSVTLATAPPQDPNNPAPPPGKNNLQPKLLVHAFVEGQDSPESPVLPRYYLGEFQVTAATDTTVTIAPTIPLTQDQFAAGRQGPWVLYETCPVDGHDWFAGLKDEELQRMIPPQFLQAYLRDGKDATDSDPPENVWYEVKFEKEHEIAVDAPAAGSLAAEPFNTDGQAVQSRLRRGGEDPAQAGKVMFGPKEGQIPTAVLDQQTAAALIDQGIATLVRKVYRRRLTDYERLFHALNERTNELNGRLRQLDLDNKAMLAVAEKADKQRALVEELKGKATDDLAKAQFEVAELDKYLNSLTMRLVAVQTELSELYKANKAISRELAARTAELTDEINRRTREATAMSPR